MLKLWLKEPMCTSALNLLGLGIPKNSQETLRKYQGIDCGKGLQVKLLQERRDQSLSITQVTRGMELWPTEFVKHFPGINHISQKTALPVPFPNSFWQNSALCEKLAQLMRRTAQYKLTPPFLFCYWREDGWGGWVKPSVIPSPSWMGDPVLSQSDLYWQVVTRIHSSSWTFCLSAWAFFGLGNPGTTHFTRYTSEH